MTNLLDLIGLQAGDAARLGFLVLVFCAVILAVYGVSTIASSGSAVRRRVSGDISPMPSSSRAESLSYADDAIKISPLIAPLARPFVPTDMAKISALRRRLVCAGYHRPSAIGVYYTARILLAVAVVLLFALAAPFLSTRVSDRFVPLIGLGGAALAFYAPDIWIGRRTRSLQQQYREGFPDALDLLVVCVEAGLSLDAGITRVGKEISHAHPAIAENFAMMSLELRAGGSRADVLHNLAERMGIDEVRSMVTLLLQSEELGTSVAEALRLYADDMRTMRMLRAETKAQALPVKLALPLGFFVFPTMMIVILLPVMIRIYRLILHK